MLMTKLIIWD